MSEYDSVRNIHIGGYHGTDFRSAERIAEEGFRDGNGDVFLAPLDNLSFAQTHGARRAREVGDQYYGVVQAMFPGKKLEFGLGGEQIRIPTDEVGRIIVVGLRVYDLEQSKLMLMKNREELHSPNL